jgi:intein/homing endonuclease
MYTTGNSLNGANISALGQNPAFYDTMLTGLASELDHTNFRFYKDIYDYDTIGGACVDLMSAMPFSDFELNGVEESRLDVYNRELDKLNISTFFPESTVDYLVYGFMVGTLMYDRQARSFSDIMSFAPPNCELIPTPLRSRDPIIKVTQSDQLKQFMNSTDPRVVALRKKIPDQLLTGLKSRVFELDPLVTLYMARRTFTHSPLGTSIYKRLLPIYFLEKTLYKGTIVEAGRRQRSLLHLAVGDDTWEPTVEELTAIVSLFQQADLDPLGAIIATRAGVNPNELRQGGDFWKWTDVIDILNPAKLRALGTSESFLAGDACVVPSTLIQTSQGIMPIGSIATPEKGEWQSVDLTVNSRFGKERAVKLYNPGKKPTLKVETALGNKLQATTNHRLLTLTDKGTTEWTYLRDLRVGDMTVVATKPLVRKTNLALSLKTGLNVVHGGQRKQVKRPENMDTNLAWLLGMYIAEGHVFNDASFSVSNTDMRVLDTWSEKVDQVFGLEATTRTAGAEVGTRGVINGVGYTTNRQCHQSYFTSKTVKEWFTQLGVHVEKGRSAARSKVVPWSILQADEQSQLAFLAAYLEGDGSIHPTDGRIAFHSSSRKILEALQAMLNAHGVLCKLAANGALSLEPYDSKLLLDKLGPYMVSKGFEYGRHKARSRFGIPNTYWMGVLRNRKVKHDRHGIVFLDDDNIQIKLRGFKAPWGEKSFCYDRYEEGEYDAFLADLKKISRRAHGKLIELLKLRYRFAEVTSIKKGGTRQVYDLSIERGSEPAYVANGLVSHNTYNNMETGLSVLVENLQAFRNRATYVILYNRILPLIAAINGFEKKTEKTPDRPKEESKTSPLGGTRMLKLINDTSNWDIPEVIWAKALGKDTDTSLFDTLDKLTEHGIPVPLRMWAAAGGVKLDSLADDLRADKDLKKLWAGILGEDDPEGGKDDRPGKGFEEDSEDGESVESSLHTTFRPRKALLGRDFGESGEIVGRTKTGQRQYIPNQREANARVNDKIAKAVLAIATDPEVLKRSLDKVRHANNGRVPNLYGG